MCVAWSTSFGVLLVFEKVSLKHEVFAEAERAVGDWTPCSARTPPPCRSPCWPGGCGASSEFIGLHFFSPVDKMPLEIIRGERASDEALARALDFAAQIKKTPIVVNDSRSSSPAG